MILDVKDLSFKYAQGAAISLPDIRLEPGESVLVMGPSGSGKSTFLNLVSGVVPVQQGQIELLGQSYSSLSRRQLDRLRADHMGVIFQTLNLIPYLSGYENARVGVRFSGSRSARCPNLKTEIERIATALGLTPELLSKKADHLSIGQQQRIAVIRALLGQPELIIADEPTSALDPIATERFIRELLETLNKQTQSVLMVSHNLALAPFFDRVVEFTEQ